MKLKNLKVKNIDFNKDIDLVLKKTVRKPSIKKKIQFIMRIIGAYGIIQVFAQDIGLPTGCKQAKFMHNPFIQLIVLTCCAYSVTDDFVQSFAGTSIYFLLKYIYSRNRTLSDVCFPTKDEINNCENNKPNK